MSFAAANEEECTDDLVCRLDRPDVSSSSNRSNHANSNVAVMFDIDGFSSGIDGGRSCNNGDSDDTHHHTTHVAHHRRYYCCCCGHVGSVVTGSAGRRFDCFDLSAIFCCRYDNYCYCYCYYYHFLHFFFVIVILFFVVRVDVTAVDEFSLLRCDGDELGVAADATESG